MAKTIDDMVTSAKRYAEMENSTFISDAEWFEYINRGLEELWELFQKTFGAEHFLSKSSVAIVSGTDEYALNPVGVLHSIWYEIGGQTYAIERFELDEEPHLRNQQATALGLVKYHMFYDATQADTDTTILLLPTPSGAATLHYRYTPRFVPLNTGQSFDTVAGYEEYAELLAAIKAKNKEESDTSALVGDLNRLRSRISEMRGRRDGARPPRVKRTRRRLGYGAFRRDWWY